MDVKSVIKISDDTYKCKHEKLYAWITVVVTTIVFSLVLINKYYPITEGWFQDYARYILKGDFIYRDFYCPVPPVYIWITTVLCKLTNYSFMSLRIYGVIERIVLITIVFELLCKVFKEKIVAIALIVGSVIYASTNTDLFYGYYQSALLFAIITLYFCVRMYEKYDENNYIYAIMYGIMAGITFCVKQNTGAIFPTLIGIGYIILTFKKNLKKTILNMVVAFFSAMCVLGILFVILSCNNALVPFFEQVIGGTSSKGSLGSIFFSFIPRMITKHSVIIFAIAIVTLIVFAINKYTKHDKVAIISSVILYIIFWHYILFDLFIPFYGYEGEHLFSLSSLFYISIVFIICAAVIVFVNHSYRINEKRISGLYYIIITMAFALSYILISIYKNWYTDYLVVRENRAYLIYALFFFNIVYILYMLYRYFRDGDNAIKLILYIASFSLMYIHGMSYIVEDHGTLLLFSLIIGEILTCKVKFDWIKEILIGLFCVLSVLSISVQRNNFSYNWWGVFTLPDTYSARYKYNDPKLKGIYGEKGQVDVMNDIYDIININKKEGDLMYTFPHINYFNVMSELDSPTFAKVHYFDVCSDERAKKDAKILEEVFPTFIVWQELNAEEWYTHEAIFRNGQLCGQRDIQSMYYKMVESGKYKLLGVFNIYQSDPIYVWGLDDGREWIID